MIESGISVSHGNLEHIIAEDSFLTGLEIRAGDRVAVLHLEPALDTDHPLYAPPQPDEVHCYRLGRLEFSDAEIPAPARLRIETGPGGEADLGSFHGMYRKEPGVLCVEGSFDDLVIRCSGAHLTFETQVQGPTRQPEAASSGSRSPTSRRAALRANLRVSTLRRAAASLRRAGSRTTAAS